MAKDKTTHSEASGRNGKDLSEQSLTILLKEYDSLREFYIHAENSAQSIFNFYLTLVTTMIGGVVVISQVPTANAAELLRSKLLVIGIVLFATLVGSIYSSALSIRYANMARYAHCMDEIRKDLLNTVSISLPAFYESFLKSRTIPKSKGSFIRTLDFWLAPTGTYHFFVSTINSACFATVLWSILDIIGFTKTNLNQSITATTLVFVALYFTHNFFSRFTMLRVISRLKARLGTGRDIEIVHQSS